jgi:hypothetical protein
MDITIVHARHDIVKSATRHIYTAQLHLLNAIRPTQSTELANFLCHNFGNQIPFDTIMEIGEAQIDTNEIYGQKALRIDPATADQIALENVIVAWQILGKVEAGVTRELENLG